MVLATFSIFKLGTKVRISFLVTFIDQYVGGMVIFLFVIMLDLRGLLDIAIIMSNYMLAEVGK